MTTAYGKHDIRNPDFDAVMIKKTELEHLRAEIERLRALVKDLADDLEAVLDVNYPQKARKYPSEQRRYERDMANVYEARRALEHKP